MSDEQLPEDLSEPEDVLLPPAEVADRIETVKRVYGLRGGKDTSGQYPLLEDAAAPLLPTSLSYEYGPDGMPPIEDQGQTPSCVANAYAAQQEFIIKKRRNETLTIARAAIYSQGKRSYEGDDFTEEGMFIPSAVQVGMNFGYVNESDFAFTDTNLSAEVPENLWHTEYKEANYSEVTLTVAAVKKALYTQGPVLFALDFPTEWDYPPATGRLQDGLKTGDGSGGHCMLIVGYSDTLQCFRLRNSWGPTWGDNGYGWMPYDMLEVRGWNAYVVSSPK